VYFVLWYEVGFAALAVVIIGAYMADNFAALRFAIPAAALQAAAVLNLSLAARQLVGLHAIDFAGPVLSIQRALADVHIVRARSNRWLLLSAPLLWALLVIVVPHGLAGFDVYRAFGFAWAGRERAARLPKPPDTSMTSRRSKRRGESLRVTSERMEPDSSCRISEPVSRPCVR